MYQGGIMKKKLVGDMTLKDFKKHCDRQNDCKSCKYVDICGIPFGAISRKELQEVVDDD